MKAGTAIASAVLLSGCGGGHPPEPVGPAGLAYACADGRAARILFRGGDPNRTAAVLTFDGREHEMIPGAAASGLRYRSAEGLVWASEGAEAAIIEATADGEREIVRCTRLREGEVRAFSQAGEWAFGFAIFTRSG